MYSSRRKVPSQDEQSMQKSHQWEQPGLATWLAKTGTMKAMDESRAYPAPLYCSSTWYICKHPVVIAEAAAVAEILVSGQSVLLASGCST